MGLIKELAEVWRVEIEKRKRQKEKYRIEYAFTCGGTRYYRYADINNLPFERGLTALAIYNEVEQRCSRNFLLKYTEAVDKILNDKTINIYKLKELNDILKCRLTLTADIDLLYKLASVVFFDKTENPNVYEQEYAEKKIAKWKKHKGVADFFLQKPLKELIPYLQNVEVDLDTYTKLNEELNKIHESKIRILSSNDK